MHEKLAFVGTLVTSSGLKNLEIISGFLTVENGVITQKGTLEEYAKLCEHNSLSKFKVTKLGDDQFLMPGFIDCHTHGPQFPNLGIGLDRPLLEWLDNYTFPLETKFSNKEYAKDVYGQVVKRLLNNGTTTACYFGSLHLSGTLELVKSVVKYQQRALVGKVSMNKENDAGYYNDTEKEMEDATKFVEEVLAFNNELVSPIITPRFAISCDKDVMKKLANLAAKHDCHIQSHISENLDEIKETLRQNPDCSSYAEVYDKCGILTSKCIMAHGVHLTEAELVLLRSRGVGVAHCPASNTRLRSGLCPVRRLIDSGLHVGLGTDVAGGDSASILDAIRRAMDVSTHLELQGDSHRAINWKEALYLATLGGAKALSLDKKIGSLEVGKEFDALLIEVYPAGGPIDRSDNPLGGPDDERVGLVQRFVYAGDDRNIARVYVKGHLVKDGTSLMTN